MHIIAGQYRHRKLSTPKGTTTRPTAGHLRETLFNITQGYIEGAHFLDLFAGSGAVGFEALSRGAASCTFVENHKDAFRCIQENIETLNVKDCAKLIVGDVFRVLETLKKNQKQFDIIFADPPYHTFRQAHPSFSQSIIEWVDQNSILLPGGYLFVEESADFQPSAESLKTLVLKSSRRLSSAILQQYQKAQPPCLD